MEPHKIRCLGGCLLFALIGANAGAVAFGETAKAAKVKAGSPPAVASREINHPARDIHWFTDVEPAWQAAQREGRPLLVYVTHEQCVFCRKMEKQTYLDPAITSAIEASFVPLSLDGGKGSALVKDLAVKSYPATFIISPQAVVVDRIDGYVPAEQLAKRLAKAAPRKASHTTAQPVAERKYSSTARSW